MAITPDSRSQSESQQFDDDSHSLTSSVTNYPIEHGRRYHRYHEGSYAFPNDELELDRMDLQYEMLRQLNHGNIFFAPLRDPERILDIGTGSGIWPIEMAGIFPNAEINGTDLSPIQPIYVPENVHFYVDDATDEWLWPVNHFDLIHASILVGSLVSLEEFVQTCLHHLKPGGWLECHEWDATIYCDDDSLPPPGPNYNSSYALLNWTHLFSLAAEQLGRSMDFAKNIANWMRDAGFVDVEERVRKVPVNPWPRDPHLKRIGAWSERNILNGLAGFSYRMFGSGGLGWTQEQIELFLMDVRRSLQDRSVHAYHHFYIVTGRKPETGEADNLGSTLAST